jgi:hypothetical protein
MNHIVVKVGTKFHYKHFPVTQTVGSIYAFRNSANGCWGVYVHANETGDCLLEEFLKDFESGKLIIEEQPNA